MFKDLKEDFKELKEYLTSFTYENTPLKINWQPQSGKQELAFTYMTDLTSDIYDIGFGGARGAGKSELAINANLQLMYALGGNYNGLYLRNTSASLNEIIERFLKALERDQAQYRFNSQKNIIKLSSGASLRFYHIENKGLISLQGSNITHCTLEEPQYFPNIADDIQPKINSFVRSSSLDVKTKVFWLFNPLGPSTKFLKEYFVDKGNNSVYEDSSGKKRVFIQATVEDNPLLLKNDPNYKKNLEALPSHMRSAWLDGSFDVSAGVAFDVLSKEHNAIASFDIRAKKLPWFISLDWGFRDATAVGFYAVDSDTIVIKFDELKLKALTPHEVAMILKEKIHYWGESTLEYMVADPAIFNRTQGDSIGAQFEQMGLYFEPANNQREAGFIRLYSRIKNQEVLFFDNLEYFWSSVPFLMLDEKKESDIAQNPKQDDHSFDETRYAMMSLHLLKDKKGFKA